MKILGFELNISRTRVEPGAAPQKGFSPEVAAWLAADDSTNGVALNNAYQQVVWVYRAVNVLAEQIANIPFRFSIGEAGGEHLITSGPLLDFYAHPHPHINRFEYWELRILWLMLRGECFRVPLFESESSGIPAHPARLKSVLILDPSRFEHIIEDHELIGWRYTVCGDSAPLAPQVFLPEEVWSNSFFRIRTQPGGSLDLGRSKKVGLSTRVSESRNGTS